MIIESDDTVYVVDRQDEQFDGIIKAIKCTYGDEWIVFMEDEYGEVTSEMMTERQLEEEFGSIPEEE